MLSSFKPASTEQFEDHFQGVPQGTPIAPIVSILALVEPLQKVRNTVMYADDGLIYGDEIENPVFPDSDLIKEANIIQHPDKSKWIKKDGK